MSELLPRGPGAGLFQPDHVAGTGSCWQGKAGIYQSWQAFCANLIVALGKTHTNGATDMTEITKPVRRKTRGSYSTLYVKPRPVVVAILPGDVLEFREHGRRHRWLLAIDTAFKYAIKQKAMADAAEKRKAKRK